jgi:hypothetical protein
MEMHEQEEALEGATQTLGMLRMQADTMCRGPEEEADLFDDVTVLLIGLMGSCRLESRNRACGSEERW